MLPDGGYFFGPREPDTESRSWLYGSGCLGLTNLTVSVGGRKPAPGRFTVRLHFCEHENDQAGIRVFDVSVQGRTVAEALDIFKTAGGRYKPLVKEFPGVEAVDDLRIQFRSRAENPGARQMALLNAVEIVREVKR
jgi:hypothetical protein